MRASTNLILLLILFLSACSVNPVTGKRELMIPFVRAYMKRVDTEAGILEFDLPEGLVETCASRS